MPRNIHQQPMIHMRTTSCATGSEVHICGSRGTCGASDSNWNDALRAVAAAARRMLLVASVIASSTS
eukprot:4980208-Amphidinium_carterae.1